LCVIRRLNPSDWLTEVVVRRKFCAAPGRFGNGMYCSNADAPGSMRSDGMRPFGNGRPVAGSIGAIPDEKSPARIAAVGTVAY
jgi:hypothetical protein